MTDFEKKNIFVHKISINKRIGGIGVSGSRALFYKVILLNKRLSYLADDFYNLAKFIFILFYV